jgi:hypothetical protein
MSMKRIVELAFGIMGAAPWLSADRAPHENIVNLQVRRVW